MLTLSMHDAKLQYIRNWQALQDFGITYFLVKVGRSRKEVSKNSVSNLITIPEFHPYYTHTPQRSSQHFISVVFVISISLRAFKNLFQQLQEIPLTCAQWRFLPCYSLYNMFNVHVVDINKLTSTFYLIVNTKKA